MTQSLPPDPRRIVMIEREKAAIPAPDPLLIARREAAERVGLAILDWMDGPSHSDTLDIVLLKPNSQTIQVRVTRVP